MLGIGKGPTPRGIEGGCAGNWEGGQGTLNCFEQKWTFMVN
jgi:hypothetical protein